jgi:hypothetical protein
MKTDDINWGERSGQAMVEFVVALVCILVLVAGIIQIAVLGFKQSRLMSEARREAGQKAMLEASSFAGPQFISACTVGSDEIAYSLDDGKTDGDVSELTVGVASHAKPEALNDLCPDNPISTVAGSAFPHFSFGLVESERTERVDLIPIIRELVYGKDSVELKGTVWMTWTKGLY